MLKVRYVKYGLGNRFSNHIELNKHLKKYPKVHDKILKHERAHTDLPWSFYDMALDFQFQGFDVLMFMIRYPSTWVDFSPIWRRDGNWIVDFNLLIFTLVCIATFALTASIFW